MLIKGRDIVIIGLQPWYYEIGSNCKNIALQFAKYNRVLYVNTPINRKTWMAKENNAGIQSHIDIIRGKTDPVKQLDTNLWELYPTSIVESINFLPSTALFKIVNSINNRRFATDIKKAIKALGFNNIILFNDNDFFNGHQLKRFLKPSTYLYYSRDYLRGFSYWKKHGDVLEPEMIRNADAALANSLYLRDYCASFNPQSFYIGQGCNLELFNASIDHQRPPEMNGLKGPVVGYVGALTSERLDISIIEIISKSLPGWNVVLVGPEDEAFRNSTLHQLSNVHFYGRQPLERLPSFIRYFDVCINPQLVNIITVGNYPLKVDEYLAMGKPVVATATKTMELFSDHTYLPTSREQYPELIQKALEENTPDKQQARIAFAQSHTWENCMQAIGDAVQKIKAS